MNRRQSFDKPGKDCSRPLRTIIGGFVAGIVNKNKLILALKVAYPAPSPYFEIKYVH